MSYVVLARKYRPMSFDDLVGQDHVARTLSNAIAAGRVAHAFLFTGVRGVGKTTSARILAKALNCMGQPGTVAPGTDPGPTASPCLECPACREITAGSDVDVQEIDGASYNGVDEVRRLQDSLPYRPQRDRYKIVIVDEVHMLSQSAWNAFLKTLEEPPPHVKFIFATTEVHKVPVTILSRVQRFDFKLIATRQIMERLRYVLGREGITADDAALSIVAREAAGSMRDAMSLLDQVIAWGGTALTGEGVARVLGVASRKVLHDLAAALVVGTAPRCLEIVDELATQGFDMPHVSRDLLALLRDLVVAKVTTAPQDLLDLPDEECADVMALATGAEVHDLMRLHQGFSQGFDDVARSSQPRAALEMLLVRLALRPPLLPLDELLTRIGALERRLTGGGGASGSSSGSPGGGAGRPAPGRGNDPIPPERARSAPAEVKPDATLLAKPPAPPAPTAPEVREPAPAPAPVLVSGAAPAPAPAPTLTPAPEPPSESGPRQPLSTPGEPQTRAAPELPPEPLPVPSRWRSIIERVRSTQPQLAAFLGHAHPLRVADDHLELGWEPDSIFVDPCSTDAALGSLREASRAVLGTEPAVAFRRDYVPSKAEPGQETVARVEAREREQARRQALERVRRDPLVLEAIEVLGARVKELRVPEP